MSLVDNFKSIDGASSALESRQRLVQILRDKASELQSNPDDYAEIAYQIAGFLATNFAQQLSSDDPIDEILTIAGELETSPDNAVELRKELLQKINSLN